MLAVAGLIADALYGQNGSRSAQTFRPNSISRKYHGSMPPPPTTLLVGMLAAIALLRLARQHATARSSRVLSRDLPRRNCWSPGEDALSPAYPFDLSPRAAELAPHLKPGVPFYSVTQLRTDAAVLYQAHGHAGRLSGRIGAMACKQEPGLWVPTVAGFMSALWRTDEPYALAVMQPRSTLTATCRQAQLPMQLIARDTERAVFSAHAAALN